MIAQEQDLEQSKVQREVWCYYLKLSNIVKDSANL